MVAKRQSRGEKYWVENQIPLLVPEQLVEELAKRNVKLHGFYIGRGPAAYFQEISKKTQGEARQYEFQGANAPKELTDFIVMKVLSGVGGSSKGQELVTAYRMRFP